MEKVKLAAQRDLLHEIREDGLSVLRLMLLAKQVRCEFVHLLPQLPVIRLQQWVFDVEAQISEGGAEIGVMVFSVEEEVAPGG